jgi:hypothetical protein
VVAFAQVDAGGVEQLTPAHASPLLPLEPDDPLEPDHPLDPGHVPRGRAESCPGHALSGGYGEVLLMRRFFHRKSSSSWVSLFTIRLERAFAGAGTVPAL